MGVTELEGGDVELVLDAKAQLGEGPLWDDRAGVLWWLDIMRGHVHRFDPRSGDDRIFEVGQPVGAAALREQGDSLVLAAKDGFATLDLRSGSVAMLAEVEIELSGNRLNDGYCDPRGRFWAGSMSMGESETTGSLYRLDADHTATKMLSGVGTSNGIDWSPDERTMYFADTPTQNVDAFDFEAETGAISNRRTLITLPDGEGSPDGLVLDEDGWLWVALWRGSQLRRYSPDGELHLIVHLPAERVTKCAFGGAGFDELYITTASIGLSGAERAEQPHAGSVFRCRPGVRGRAATRYRG